MALVIADRVRETTSVVGTGTATLLGAVTGYQSFSVVGNTNTTYYCIAGQGNSEWEVGLGTYASSGTTLARTTVLASSNAGSLVNFSAGTKDVFVTYPSEKSVNLDAAGLLTAPAGLGTGVPTALNTAIGTAGSFVVNGGVLGTPSSGTLTNATGLPVSTGVSGLGAGVATFLGTPSSANLAAAVTDETGSGALVFGTAPTLDTAVITATGSTAALRITNTGAGNSLVVEDSTNPDSTPFVIDSNGNVIQGTTQRYSVTPSGVATFPLMQVHGANANSYAFGYEAANWATTTGSGAFSFAKSRGGVIGTHAIVSSGDALGTTGYFGSDGTDFIRGAEIVAAVDGTPGTNDMPGRLIFSTTPAGASTPIERMRLNASGNLGLGVVPSAWLSSARSLDISGYASFSTWNNASGVINNAYYNSSSQWIYKNSAAASNYYQVSGQHVWSIAPSGTAGAAISFTQAMTLNASGNLGIGTASPTYKLDAQGTTAVDARVYATDVSTGKAKLYIRGGSTNFSYETDASNNTTYLFDNTNGALASRYWAGASGYWQWFTVGSERMRIDSSGNVGIGNTPSGAYKLEVSGKAAATTQVSTNGITVNSQTMTTSQTIAAGTSGFTVGPFTMAPGAVLTIESGARHVII